MNSSSQTKTPQYLELAQKFKRDIEKGSLRAGDRLPPFLEMKASHGLSQSAWERMLGLLEREQLIVREERRGTFVADSPSPRLQKSGTHYTLGVIGWGFSLREIFWTQILNGIHEAAHAAGCDVTLLHRSGRVEGWEKVDGVLLSGEQKPQALLKSKPMSLPCVQLLVSERKSRDVDFDEAGGVQAALRHLLELGHRRIGYLLTDHPIATPRWEAYCAALRAERIRPRSAWVRRVVNPSPAQENYLYCAAQEGMKQWLRADWSTLGCTALLCQNDQIALGALAALHEAGVLVPRDVSLVGFDGTEISEYSHPRLTTIEVPLHEVGRRGAQMLIERIAQENGDKATKITRASKVVLPVRLKIGESSAPPRGQAVS